MDNNINGCASSQSNIDDDEFTSYWSTLSPFCQLMDDWDPFQGCPSLGPVPSPALSPPPPPPPSFDPEPHSLAPDTCPNNPQYTDEWTEEEKRQFDVALAEFNTGIPSFFDYLAARIPGKSMEQIQERFIYLLDNLPPTIDLGNSTGKNQFAEVEENNEDSDSSSESGTRRRRKRGIPWTEEEHGLFLMGLNRFGKGNWKSIHRHFLKSKTAKQIASHAQKFFLRGSREGVNRRKWSILDIRTVDPNTVPELPKKRHYVPIAPAPYPPSSGSCPQHVDYNMAHEGPNYSIPNSGQMPNYNAAMGSASALPPFDATSTNSYDGGYMNYPADGWSMGSSSNTMMNDQRIPFPYW